LPDWSGLGHNQDACAANARANEISEMAGHGTFVVSDKNPVLLKSEFQYFWVGNSIEAGGMSALKINGRFLAQNPLAN